MVDTLRFGTVSAPQTTPRSGTPAAIEHIHLLGLHHLEIAWVRSVRVHDETCAEICHVASNLNVSLSIHAPYFINLNSQTHDKMLASDERLLMAARKGFLTGARDIVFHPASYHGQSEDIVYERVRSKLAELVQVLREEGTDVILRPETMGKPALFGSLDEVIQLSKDIPGVLPCIDWAHLHARQTDGSFNSYGEFHDALSKVKAELGEAALKQVHFHLSGIAYGPRGEQCHLPLNEADLRYMELLQAFIDFDLEGTAAVEAPEPFHTADALTFQATYRRRQTLGVEVA